MIFQTGAALLECCVLAVLDREDTYGYVLTQRVKGVLQISESTLYPVLRRLQKEASLSTYDRVFQGRNRRYYSITPQGREKLQQYRTEWEAYKNRIDDILLRGLCGDE